MKMPEVQDYPKSILVNQEWYTIKFCKEVTVEGDSVYGACDPVRYEIRVKISEPIVMFQTFIHELLHAIAFEYNFKLSHRVIELLEGPLATLFLHNF